MFGSQILEVVIGMILIYLLFSLLLSAARELIEGLLKTRAVDLEKAMAELLQDPEGTADRASLMGHSLIYSLFPGEYKPTKTTSAPAASGNTNAVSNWSPTSKDTPSYIPSGLFADAIIDLYKSGKLVKAGESLDALLRAAGGDTEKWRTGIMQWYDAGMDRATGWYKRQTQGVLFGLGLILAIGMNVNSATLLQHLATNDALRQTLVGQAEAQVAAGSPQRPDTCTETPSTECVKALGASVQGLGLPIGWGAEGWAPWAPVFDEKAERFNRLGQAVLLAFGILATAFAMCLGAPFWFDLLNKVVNLRSTLKPLPEPAPGAVAATVTAAGAKVAATPPTSAAGAGMHEHHHLDQPSLQPQIYG
jgi:hypothetical protein